METKKFFSDIPITDMIRVTSLANPYGTHSTY